MLIVAVIAALVVFFALSLRRDEVSDIIERDSLVRMLFVIEDDRTEVLFSSVLLYNPATKKGAAINLPGNTGAIYQSLGRVDRLENVYNDCGIETYRTEVEKLLGVRLPFYTVIKLDDFIKLCDMLGGMRVFIPSPIDQYSEDGERWLLPSGAIKHLQAFKPARLVVTGRDGLFNDDLYKLPEIEDVKKSFTPIREIREMEKKNARTPFYYNKLMRQSQFSPSISSFTYNLKREFPSVKFY